MATARKVGKAAAKLPAPRLRADKPTQPFQPRKRADKPTRPFKPKRAQKPTKVEPRRRPEKPTRQDRPAPKLARGTQPLAVHDGWIDAGKGYQLSLDAGKLVARNAAGKRLASVPKDIKDSDTVDQLEALRDWLVEHERECRATVEQWMLRSLPVPRAVLEAVWDDPAWRTPLENAVIVAGERAGLVRGVAARRGVGVVDLDGETVWLAADAIAIPHPVRLPELDAWRELVTQLGVAQGIAQLHRETHHKPGGLRGAAITQFEDGKFATLMHAAGKARALGYKIRGGFATCKVWDDGIVSEARYWIGADAPDAETYTGQLLWVDGKERALDLADVGAVAFSEGMRMASAIYAARVVDKPAETP